MIEQLSMPMMSTGLVDSDKKMTRVWYDFFKRSSDRTRQSGQCTLSLTGCTTAPTGVFDYVILAGDIVVLTPPAAVGLQAVSNAVSCTLTGLPVILSPDVDALGCIHLTNNSTGAFGMFYIAPNTTTIRLDAGVVAGAFLNNNPNGFTAAGTKGVGPWDHFIYRLRRL